MGRLLLDSQPTRGIGRARLVLTLTACTFGIALGPTLACTPDSEKNYEERRNVATDQLDPGCIDQCLHVAEGSPVAPPVDCAAAEEGIEFYPLPIWDFDGPTQVGSNMYTYTDNSSAFLDPNGWEPRTEQAERCSGRPNNRVLHVHGGPFVDWGGGIGRDLKCLNYSPMLGAFKLDELGIPPEDYLNYTLVDSTIIENLCDTTADCRPGMDCVDDGTSQRCRAPACTSNDDCNAPGWYCPAPGSDPSAVRNCERYVTDRSCGEPPSWVLPETGTRYSATTEGACESGDDSDDPLYLQYRDLIESACPQRDQEALLAESSQDSGEEEFMLGLTLDMSEWEGISFWARRTVDSQAGIRIAVGDKYTDDDLSYQQFHINPESELYCRRNRECGFKTGSSDTCLDQRPCTHLETWDEGTAQSNPQNCKSDIVRDGLCTDTDLCFDPETDLPREGWTCAETDGRWECSETTDAGALQHMRCADDCSGIANCVAPGQCPEGHECSTYQFGDPDDPTDDERYCWNTLWDQVPNDPEHEFQVCGDSACDFIYRPFQKADAQFYGKTCQQFAFAGGIQRGYCYDPDAEDDGPFESQFLCGDHWLKPVYLSDEWQFYKIPFAELLQQGWAKEAHEFDLTSLAVIRFTWDRGWVDYYIDDVRFYRYK